MRTASVICSDEERLLRSNLTLVSLAASERPLCALLAGGVAGRSKEHGTPKGEALQ